MTATPKPLPKLSIQKGDCGEIFVVDECNHQVAAFRVKSPECHRAPYIGHDNFNGELNLIIAQEFISVVQRCWQIL